MKYAEDIEIYNTEKQEQRLFQLLVALNGKYETIKKEILRADPLPSVETAYSILRREDARSAILQTGDSGAQGIGAGLVVTQQWQNPAAHRNTPQRSGGGSGGNWSRRPDEDKSKLMCTHCGKKKHTRDTCFELHGYPEWWQERKTKNNLSSAPFRGGRAAAAVAGGEGASITAVGSNHGVAINRGGISGTEEAAIGTVSIARGGGGGATSPQAEFSETEAFQLDGGKLGIEELSSNPPSPKLSHLIPHLKENCKSLPPDFDKSPYEPRNARNCKNNPKPSRHTKPCPKIRDYPQTAPILCENRFQILENLPTSYALSVSSKNKNDKWIFDCGATDTITYDIADISDMHKAVRISSTLTLSNCLYVPSMSHKLLSISHVTKELNCTLLMQPNFCLLQDIRTGEIIGRGTEQDGLYYVDEIAQ